MFFFKLAPEVDRAELAVRVYDDIYAVGVSHGHATNVADIGSVGCVEDSAITVIADGNNVLESVMLVPKSTSMPMFPEAVVKKAYPSLVAAVHGNVI